MGIPLSNGHPAPSGNYHFLQSNEEVTALTHGIQLWHERTLLRLPSTRDTRELALWRDAIAQGHTPLPIQLHSNQDAVGFRATLRKEGTSPWLADHIDIAANGGRTSHHTTPRYQRNLLIPPQPIPPRSDPRLRTRRPRQPRQRTIHRRTPRQRHPTDRPDLPPHRRCRTHPRRTPTARRQTMGRPPSGPAPTSYRLTRLHQSMTATRG